MSTLNCPLSMFTGILTKSPTPVVPPVRLRDSTLLPLRSCMERESSERDSLLSSLLSLSPSLLSASAPTTTNSAGGEVRSCWSANFSLGEAVALGGDEDAAEDGRGEDC